MKMHLFVTVGTTEFGGLVEGLVTEELQSVIERMGVKSITIQAGKAKVDASKCMLPTTVYSYKPSIEKDIANADLIISHAGAGTCLEVLTKGKPLIVVVNDTLMGNHQTELAEKMAESGYLEYATLSTLQSVLQQFRPGKLTQYPKPNGSAFAGLIMDRLGHQRPT